MSGAPRCCEAALAGASKTKLPRVKSSENLHRDL